MKLKLFFNRDLKASEVPRVFVFVFESTVVVCPYSFTWLDHLLRNYREKKPFTISSPLYPNQTLPFLRQLAGKKLTEKMKDDVVIVVLASAVGLLGALLISVALFWVIKSRRKLAQKSRLVQLQIKRRRFSYGEVVKMTNNFRQVIGWGGFGTMYHGHLDGAPVAVKLYHKENGGAAGLQTEVEASNYIPMLFSAKYTFSFCPHWSIAFFFPLKFGSYYLKYFYFNFLCFNCFLMVELYFSRITT